jgi:hypothetical protein
MDRPVTHPTKEQVRAYMLAREHAYRPPPPPEEIRRQLNWHCVNSEPNCVLASFCLLPATLGQFVVQAMFGWCLAQLTMPAAGHRAPASSLPS